LKRIILLILALFFLLSANAFAQEEKKYVVDTYPIIKYPDSWKKVASEENIYEDRFHNTFRITLPNEWQPSKMAGTFFAATAPAPSSLTIKIYVTILNTKTELPKEDIDKFVDFLIEEAGILKDKNHITIDNRDATRFITVNDNKSIYKLCYFFQKEGLIFRVECDGKISQLDDEEKTFDQIMSTFKLLN